MNPIFDMAFAVEVFPALIQGLWVTVQATAAGFCLAVVFGFVIFLIRADGPRWARLPLSGVADFIRSTPILVQLFFAYFVLPDVGISLDPVITGALVLGIHYACYTSETYRAAFLKVATGQYEAARSLGLTRLRAYGLVVLPQMLPVLVPGLGNYLIIILKETPALSAITVTEMLYSAKIAGAESFRYLEPITLSGLIFLVISSVLSWFLRFIEGSLRWIQAGQKS